MCSRAIRQSAVLRGGQAQDVAAEVEEADHQEDEQDHSSGKGHSGSKEFQEATFIKSTTTTTTATAARDNSNNNSLKQQIHEHNLKKDIFYLS